MKHNVNLILSAILIPIVLLSVLPELLIVAITFLIWKNKVAQHQHKIVEHLKETMPLFII
jgi:hypothetical protein